MTDATYVLHTPESAPETAAEALRALQMTVGLIPNLAATMAESPALLNGFLALRERFAQTGFSAGEVQVLSLTAAYENDCAWCVAFHTAMALKEGVDRDAVDALRQGAAPAEPRLAGQQLRARHGAQPGSVDRHPLQAFLLGDGQLRRPLDASAAR